MHVFQSKISLYVAKCSHIGDGRGASCNCSSYNSKGPKGKGGKTGTSFFFHLQYRYYNLLLRWSSHIVSQGRMLQSKTPVSYGSPNTTQHIDKNEIFVKYYIF